MHYIVESLIKALSENDFKLARQIIMINLKCFKASHPILFPSDVVSDVQLKILKKLANNDKLLNFASIKDQKKLSIIQRYTSALLDFEYDEDMDQALAEFAECLPIASEPWTEDEIGGMKWNFKFYFHRALLSHVLAHTALHWWRRLGKLLTDSELPPSVLVNALIGKVILDDSFMIALKIVCTFLEKKTCQAGSSSSPIHLVERFLFGDARSFEEYLSMDLLTAPLYLHRLFGAIGVGCLERKKSVLTEDVRKAISVVVTKNAETFTRFLFVLHGHVDDLSFVRKHWLSLIDYSQPEWNLPCGEKLHLAIFDPKYGQTERDIRHLFSKSPKHLAVASLRRSKILGRDMISKFPMDQVIDFWKEGAFSNLKVPDDRCDATIEQDRERQKLAHHNPGWLVIKDTDDPEVVTVKAMIQNQVCLRQMTQTVWNSMLSEQVRNDIVRYLHKKIKPFHPLEPNMYSAEEICASPIFAYYSGLPAADSATLRKAISENLTFDAFMVTPSDTVGGQWARLWPCIPDHLWFDPPKTVDAMAEVRAPWFIMVPKDKSGRGVQLQRTRLAFTAYHAILTYPDPAYSWRMNRILDHTEQLLSHL